MIKIGFIVRYTFIIEQKIRNLYTFTIHEVFTFGT